jgi:PAS domain S-box-containing protein
METSPVGIMMIDSDGRFTFANAAAALVLGRTREQICGLDSAAATWRFTDYRGEPIAPGELPFLKTFVSGAPVRNAPLAVVKPDGNRRLLSINADRLGEDRSHPSGCVITVEDVTERVRLEQEVFRTQKLESVGVLAGGIAHDFNNLLTGIMGSISLAQMHLPAGSAAADPLADAEKASLQARELTQQLLTFSRGGKPIKQTLDLGELLTNVTQFALRGANVRADASIPGDLWSVDADKGQIAQVFHNLIINACQSMPQGGTVRIAAANRAIGSGNGIPLSPGKYATVVIADQGVGIPAEHLSKIFDPFFSTKTGGTGLGLAVVYSVVKNHGGCIEVSSVPGEGTTFTVFLPAATTAAPPVEPAAKTSPGQGRILLMDDEPVVRQVVSRMLAALGFEVITAAEGSTALTLYREALAGDAPFDAVILDLTVPGGMGGAEAIGLLRAIDPNVKAIVSSGYSSDPVMSSYRSHGFSGVIAKPFRAGDLSSVLRQVLVDDRAASTAP